MYIELMGRNNGTEHDKLQSPELGELTMLFLGLISF
jgi:hypothetical protein